MLRLTINANETRRQAQHRLSQDETDATLGWYTDVHELFQAILARPLAEVLTNVNGIECLLTLKPKPHKEKKRGKNDRPTLKPPSTRHHCEDGNLF